MSTTLTPADAHVIIAEVAIGYDEAPRRRALTMKATHFAAAAVVALAMTTSPAWAGFMPTSFFVPDNGNNVLDPGELLFFGSVGNGVSGIDSLTVKFETSSPLVLGQSSASDLTVFAPVKFLSASLNDEKLASDIVPGAISFTGGVVQQGENTLKLEFDVAAQNLAGISGQLITTPLPAAAWLMIAGLGAIAAYGRRARKMGDVASS